MPSGFKVKYGAWWSKDCGVVLIMGSLIWLLSGCHYDAGGFRLTPPCAERLEKHGLEPLPGGMMNPEMPEAHYEDYYKYYSCKLVRSRFSDQEIQYQLAYAHKTGKGVKQDHKAYLRELKKAAKPGADVHTQGTTIYHIEGANPNGHAPAQIELARYYLSQPDPNLYQVKLLLINAARQKHPDVDELAKSLADLEAAEKADTEQD